MKKPNKSTTKKHFKRQRERSKRKVIGRMRGGGVEMRWEKPNQIKWTAKEVMGW